MSTIDCPRCGCELEPSEVMRCPGCYGHNPGATVRKFDIYIENKGEKEVMCEIYADTLHHAFHNGVKLLPGYSKARYIGHICDELHGGGWIETECVNMEGALP